MSRSMQDCVILFGDSITSRQEVPKSLQALMGDSYRRTLDILNRGYGGYNTRYALPLLDQTFVKKAEAKSAPVVRLVTIWFGTNDAVLQGLDQHVPIPEYIENLRKILSALTDEDSPYAVSETQGLNIVVITPPALYPPMMDGDGAKNRTAEHTLKYVEAAVSVGKEWKAKESPKGSWKIATINAFDAMTEKANGSEQTLKSFFNDGLHLTTEGYAVVWDEYKKLVKTEFRGRGLDWEDLTDLPMRVPDWSAVSGKDPKRVVDDMKLPQIRQ